MHSILSVLMKGLEPTTDIEEGVVNLLNKHGLPEIAGHCVDVGEEAERLAQVFEVSPLSAKTAGLLHDIGAVIPNDQRVTIADELGIEVLPEEERFPLILHQKLSRVMARELFRIEDDEILSAIECHTTLRPGATALDKIVFIADKLKWDQNAVPPYMERVKKGLEISLDRGVFDFLSHMWERRDELAVVHPWLSQAYHEVNYPGLKSEACRSL